VIKAFSTWRVLRSGFAKPFYRRLMRYVEEARIYADRNEGVHTITLDCLHRTHLTYESFAQTRFLENIIFEYRDVYRN
jgi:hypothetical protein